MRRAAMSLVEMMVAVGLSCMLTLAVYAILWRGRTLEIKLEQSSAALNQVSARVKAITDEIQEGAHLFYPLAGAASSSGLGFVNARGETIFYYVSPPEGEEKSLWRECANDGGRSRTVVLPLVVWFRATTGDTGRGRVPSLVKLDIHVKTEIPGVQANIITAAFLGNLEKNLPDDSTAGPWPVPPPAYPR